MNYRTILPRIQENAYSRLMVLRDQVIGDALKFLEEDISDPLLNAQEVHPDMFMLRANQIGMALVRGGMFRFAEDLYRALLEKTLEYREKSGSWRHAGALYANIGGACAAQGNLDRAIVELLKASQDDIETYRVTQKDSYAVIELLPVYFIRPVQDKILQAAKKVDSSLELSDVESLCKKSNDRQYALLAYVHLSTTHIEANQEFPNIYSQLQIFSALRSLASLLEVEIKILSSNMEQTLLPALISVYGTKIWWKEFDTTRRKIGATLTSGVNPDKQLRNAIALSPITDESRFWKGLLVAYIVRNFTVHQLEIQSALIQDYPDEALSYILHTMITADKY